MTLRTVALAAVLCAPVPGALRAQARELPDLQVTATRASAARPTVPAAITVLDGDALRARGITYLLDALGDVPGATVAQAGSYGAQASLFLRGGESDHVKVLVDGVTMNDPGGAFDFASLSLEDVERVEIVRGPVSVLYGADAMSGVIQVFTRQGRGPLHGDVEASGGSFGRQDVRARLAGASRGWHASAAVSRFASDGIYAFNSGFEDVNASLHAGVDGGRRGSARVVVRWSDALNQFPTDGNGALVDRNARRQAADLAAQVAARRAFGDDVEVALEGWGHRLRSAARDEQDSAADTTGFGFAGTRDAVLERQGVSLRGDWRAAPWLRLGVGAGIERESEDQESVTRSDFGFGVLEDSAAFRAERSTRHAWVQALATLAPGAHLQVGVRSDDNSAFGRFLTGRAGVTLSPGRGVRLWAAAGGGFKAPTFSELFAASPFEVGNPRLSPESSTTIDAGAEATLHGVTLAVTAFRQSMRDLIQYVSGAPGDPTYANLQAARARGLEASLALAPRRWLDLRAHLSLLETEVTDTGATSSVVFTQGARLLRRPGARGGVTATVRRRGMVASATATWVGAREDADFRDFPSSRVTLPSYGTLDAALELPLTHAPGVGAVLLARVENLFDAAYQQVFGFEARGRTLHAGARLTF
ncbi:MAG: TonB-dependent receptor [Gemmatimonadetes bacterium]|nr:TonB-dependent receptor [Gemmatimonadota bacterium]